MDAIDYPCRREHRQEHEVIRRKVMKLAKRLERGETTMTIEFSLFLSEVVERHVKLSDHRFAESLSLYESALAVRGQFAKHRRGALWTTEVVR